MSRKSPITRLFIISAMMFGIVLSWVGFVGTSPAAALDWFELQVIDEETGRGVPQVEVITLDHRRFMTDSAGRVAICDPGLMGRSVSFIIKSHGYILPGTEKGSDQRVSVEVVPGGKSVIEIKRLNIAERLYRKTGAGIYRDTVLLGLQAPIDQPVLYSQITGQDSNHAVIYKGRIFFGYGDTSWISYPLGNFQTTASFADLPSKGGLDPSVGINQKYIESESGFSQKMFDFWPGGGSVVWIGGLCVIKDGGQERLVGYYRKINQAWDLLEHGLSIFNDGKKTFDRIMIFDINRDWQVPGGHSFIHHADGKEWVYFRSGSKMVRVPADMKSLRDPSAYEAWSCLEDGSPTEPWNAKLLRDENGKLVYRWTKNAPPVDSNMEQEYIKEGLMEPSEAYNYPEDVETGRRIDLHNGNVMWNEYRQRWILITSREGGDNSYLGEVWYSESENPTGPWRKAIKVVNHDRYTFYNPVYHNFYDQEGGRLIFFEGTYVDTFSGNNDRTPLYNYNQVVYRLDLSDPRLEAVRDEN